MFNVICLMRSGDVAMCDVMWCDTMQWNAKQKKMPSHGDFTIVLGSDGIWDCWKFDDFADYVNTCITKEKSLSETCEIVLNESITRAITNFGAKHYDDACLVILSIPTPGIVHRIVYHSNLIGFDR
jgi:hypothetical protein